MNRSGHRLYLAGGPGGSSIGPPIHEHVAHSFGLNWTCEFLQLSDVHDVVALFRRPDFAGAIVTMPHKRTIMPLLDSIDDVVKEIGACNFVVRQEDGQLRGSNTDWVGIQNALLQGRSSSFRTGGCKAMIYGAGGASRAAVYALVAGLDCERIYIVNRDEKEVSDLIADVEAYTKTKIPELIYVKTPAQAEALEYPQYIVSTVPDFEPRSTEEVTCRDILKLFLQKGRGQQYVLLDMCYHPFMTRNLKAGVDAGWTVIPGYMVVSHQFPRQWDLWTGHEVDMKAVFSMCDRLVREHEAATTPT